MPAPARGCRTPALACASAIASAVVLSACAASPPHARAAPGNGPPLEAVWQQHRTTIDYFGLTALYSCDGLADKVRTLLLYLGARPDLQVQMAGCPGGFDRPAHLTAVRADFYTLAPAGLAPAGSAAPGASSATGPFSAASTSGAAVPSGTVSARWQHVTVQPRVPIWMGLGECELLQQIRPVVTADFSTRRLRYRTDCVPHQVSISDYELSGQFLKPVDSH